MTKPKKSFVSEFLKQANTEDYSGDQKPSNLDAEKTSNLVIQKPSNLDTEETGNVNTSESNNSSIQVTPKRKKVKKKTLTVEVPVDVANFWMGQVKGSGDTFKKVVISHMMKKYGLPDGYVKDNL